MNVLELIKKKNEGMKISMLTCYDYTSACILSQTNIDCLLVGDSVAMTMHGFEDTTAATIAMMQIHIQAVRKGAPHKFIIGDLPFLSYRQSLSKSMRAAQILIQAGAHALKLEGANGNLKLIRHLVTSGVPVMGHLGLTPQFVNGLGGYKVQGKSKASAEQLLNEALQLEAAGCCAVVLECIPAELARTLTQQLSIPTLGIGAGPHTDGQVLVMQDLLGMNTTFKPKFVKHYFDGAKHIKAAVDNFVKEIEASQFPEAMHCYASG
ncbi:MAG: 3-methyl-2-oxobutanoate hydroxymethyltransferase [Gammaproteobacteria bacterium]|nr:3-methyl-2-oxobutanoate hydroxymethyltransferase [Gammaproteobacteria bacterium]